MPGADLYIPEGALKMEAEKTLIRSLTNLLIEAEGADPTNANTQSVSKIFVHRPSVYVGSNLSAAPHYCFIAMVPEGLFDPDRWKRAVENITQAFMEAEDGAWPHETGRVWVFVNEIPDGTWGASGAVRSLADMLTFSLKDADLGQRIAKERISTRKRTIAACLFEEQAAIK